MSATTTRMGLYKPAGGEDVNVVTDLNNNLDAIDLNMNFRTCTSGTRPSVVWDGLSIHETDTNKFYVWNATPASSGWYELLSTSGNISQINLSGATSGATTFTNKVTGNANSRFQLRADGLASWGDGTAAVDTFLYRNAAGVLKTDGQLTSAGALSTTSTTDSTALSVSGGASIAKSLTVGGTASLGGSQGALGIKNITTPPTAAPTAGLLLYSENGRPKLQSSTTGAENLGGAYGLSYAPQTAANTTAETFLGFITIPANDAAVGSVWRLTSWGVASVTGTPTLRFRVYLGSNTLCTSGAFTCSSGVTNKVWSVEVYLVCLATGGTGSWSGVMNCTESLSVAGALPTTAASRMDGSSLLTNSTTTSNALTLMSTWGTASASNTLTSRGFVVTRVA